MKHMDDYSLHVFGQAPVGLLYFEAKGDQLELPDTWLCRAANSTARNLLGSLSPDGLSLRELFPESIAERLSDLLLTHPATSEVDFFVSNMGAWLLASGNRVDGRLIVTLTDITKQKQAAFADHRMLNLYKSLSNSLSDNEIILFDKDFNIVLTEGAPRFVRLKVDGELVGKNLPSLFEQNEFSFLGEYVMSAFGSDRNEVEQEINGKFYRASVHTSRSDDDQENVVGVLLLKDVTELNKKQREIEIRNRQLEQHTAEYLEAMEALRKSEEKYRSIFADSLDVIYLLDTEGQFTDINDSGTQLLGYSKAEFLEKKITDLFESEAAKTLFLDKLARKENMRDFETEILASNGERCSYIIACTNYQPSGNHQNFFQGILHDITRRKKAEQELLIAEKLTATGRLVRMLGHEIRNPLTNIDLAINQLTTSNDELTDYIEIIQRNSKRISQLLTDLLQISVPGHLDFKPCAPNEILDHALDMAADRISLKNISVEKTYDLDTCDINADADKLKIAFLNIILNAVEAMEEGKGILQIETIGTADGCRVSIRDNGPGIAPENINHIFEPYFTRKPHGLGLGLSSTLNIVQSHRGRMEVESEVDKGAAFLVWLPA
jgi:PAS domain S-box-containing protein